MSKSKRSNRGDVNTSKSYVDKPNEEAEKLPSQKERALTLQRIEKLYRMFCVCKSVPKGADRDANCDSCILSDIPYQNGTLCSAIHVDKILKNYKKK